MSMWGPGVHRPNPLSHEDFPALPTASPIGGALSPIRPPDSSTRHDQQSRSGLGDPKAGDAASRLFGLAGLLNVIKSPPDSDLNPLALGYDLSALGLNLTSNEFSWYRTFACPHSETPVRVQPEFRLPSCYFMQPPGLRFSMFQHFSINTLFYIFYTMPRDVLQFAAAQELYDRRWRFHKDMRVWLTPVAGTEAQTVKTPTYEKGTYEYFDPEKWKNERLEDFILVYDSIEEKHPMQEAARAGGGALDAATSVATRSDGSVL